MESKATILLVDDDQAGIETIARALRAQGIEGSIYIATTPGRALEIQEQCDPHVAVVDLSLDDRGPQSGFKLLQEILHADPSCRVIVLTGYTSGEYGIKALNLGAANFLSKPPDLQHLAALVRDGISQSELRRECNRLSDSEERVGEEIVGRSRAIQGVREAVLHAAKTPQAVLITGATGTGKGLCARVIHQLSARKERKFVRYQPNFGSPDLASSELFGHVKGAFTGAERGRDGLLIEANGGTLFLDEIDELPRETQVALLGALQERRFRPVGSDQERESEFRLIAAMNHDLDAALKSGKLRSDLFHRIAHFRIHLPPLRSRPEDLAPLAEAALRRISAREQINVFSLGEGVEKLLAAHDWPGNVRELEARIEHAAYHAHFTGRTQVTIDDFPRGELSSHEINLTFSERVEEFKLRLIKEALQRNGENQLKASQELGLDRSTLRRILARSNGASDERSPTVNGS